MTKQEMLDNLTRTQSTKEFQQMTSGWRKVEYYKCNSCGNEDCIRGNGDAKICLECGSIEDYQLIQTIEK